MVASKGAISLHEARMMSEIDRQAMLWALAEVQGGTVDPKTGEVSWPEFHVPEE